jgi:hypothetical protein
MAPAFLCWWVGYLSIRLFVHAAASREVVIAGTTNEEVLIKQTPA